MPAELRLGTRGSQLARWQAHAVKHRLEAGGAPPCRIVVIATSGDRLQEAPLSDVGGKRLFVKEIEDALLRHEIDLAVHSSKDMPAVLPGGLTIAAVLPRDDPFDAIVLPSSMSDDRTGLTVESLVAALGSSPSIGTGSVRRIAQLTRLMPHARFTPIRGNLDTRLRKLDEGAHDALVLAAAGLRRLGFGSRIAMTLPVEVCVPAPGQGIIAVEVRDGDVDLERTVRRIDDPSAGAALRAERALVEALGGGCQTPIGALAMPVEPHGLELTAAVVSLDGSRAVRARRRAPQQDAGALGEHVANELLEQGAGEILEDVQRAHGVVEGLQP
jgi:hydroxymethylbilane synthase